MNWFQSTALNARLQLPPKNSDQTFFCILFFCIFLYSNILTNLTTNRNLFLWMYKKCNGQQIKIKKANPEKRLLKTCSQATLKMQQAVTPLPKIYLRNYPKSSSAYHPTIIRNYFLFTLWLSYRIQGKLFFLFPNITQEQEKFSCYYFPNNTGENCSKNIQTRLGHHFSKDTSLSKNITYIFKFTRVWSVKLHI